MLEVSRCVGDELYRVRGLYKLYDNRLYLCDEKYYDKTVMSKLGDKSIVKMESNSGRMTYQVSPGWAQNAVVMTGTSVEISINQLKELYFQSKGRKGPVSAVVGSAKTPVNVEFDHLSEAVTITLKPQLGMSFW